MRTEEQWKPNGRYLFADEYLADSAIEMWQKESMARLADKPKGEEYYKYINWKRENNQIAVFTLYAYADFSIPKKFDCIFRLDNPNDFLSVEYELSQSIHEAWLPLKTVDDGHKHLCIFTFKNEVPDMLYLLHKGESKFCTSPVGQIKLGFCQKSDLPAITKRIEKVIELKKQYGTDWWHYDDGE